MAKLSRLLAVMTVWPSVASVALAKGGHDDDDDFYYSGGSGGDGSYTWDAAIFYTCRGGKNAAPVIPPWNHTVNDAYFQAPSMIASQAQHKFCNATVNGSFPTYPGYDLWVGYSTLKPPINPYDCSTTASTQEFENVVGAIVDYMISKAWSWACCVTKHGSYGGTWRGQMSFWMNGNQTGMTCPGTTVNPTDKGDYVGLSTHKDETHTKTTHKKTTHKKTTHKKTTHKKTTHKKTTPVKTTLQSTTHTNTTHSDTAQTGTTETGTTTTGTTTPGTATTGTTTTGPTTTGTTTTGITETSTA